MFQFWAKTFGAGLNPLHTARILFEQAIGAKEAKLTTGY